MSEVMEFGFDDAKVIKHQGIDQFSLKKDGEKARISIVAFKKFSDTVAAIKAKEKGAAAGKDGPIPLTDEEKAELIKKIDTKLAAQLTKEVKDLTEIDRLDIKAPRFAYAWTHYDQRKREQGGVGTIRCHSTYDGNTLIKPELCCNKFGDAEQTVATVVMKYFVDDQGQVEMDIFKMKKGIEFSVWRMSAKKFKGLDATYKDAQNDKRFCIDLRVTLQGDPQFKNFKIENCGTATWAREDMDAAMRLWVLDQGLRAWKHVANNLGFEMTKEKLVERLSGAAPAAVATEAQADQPKLVASYDELLT